MTPRKSVRDLAPSDELEREHIEEAASSNQKAPEPAPRWPLIDLVEAGSVVPTPPDVFGLFYREHTATVSGPPSAGKTMALAAAMVEQILAGHSALYLDLDRMGASDMLERMRGFGLTDDQIRANVLYVQSTGVPHPHEITALAREVEARDCSLVVIDAFNPALGLFGLDPNSPTDVDSLIDRIGTPFTNAGAATIFLDHVVKDKESRGMYSSGSERKTSGTIVHIGVEAAGAGFARGREGRSKITIHRDRRGFNQTGTTFGTLTITSDPATGRLTWIVERPDHTRPFRPTGLMESISRALEDEHEAVSQKRIEQAIRGNANTVRQALKQLVIEEFVTVADGPRGALLHTLARQYRQANDPLSDRYIDPTSSTSSDLVPTSSETTSNATSSTSSVPSKGTRSTRTRSTPETDHVTSSSSDRDQADDATLDLLAEALVLASQSGWQPIALRDEPIIAKGETGWTVYAEQVRAGDPEAIKILRLLPAFLRKLEVVS